MRLPRGVGGSRSRSLELSAQCRECRIKHFIRRFLRVASLLLQIHLHRLHRALRRLQVFLRRLGSRSSRRLRLLAQRSEGSLVRRVACGQRSRERLLLRELQVLAQLSERSLLILQRSRSGGFRRAVHFGAELLKRSGALGVCGGERSRQRRNLLAQRLGGGLGTSLGLGGCSLKQLAQRVQRLHLVQGRSGRRGSQHSRSLGLGISSSSLELLAKRVECLNLIQGGRQRRVGQQRLSLGLGIRQLRGTRRLGLGNRLVHQYFVRLGCGGRCIINRRLLRGSGGGASLGQRSRQRSRSSGIHLGSGLRESRIQLFFKLSLRLRHHHGVGLGGSLHRQRVLLLGRLERVCGCSRRS